MNEWEVGAPFNIAETCVDSLSLDELFELTGTDRDSFLAKLTSTRMTYGDIEGLPAYKDGIASLFRTVTPDDIVTTHGATGANHHVFYSLVDPGDKVVSIMPTYQQLYSIPAAFGAKVDLIHLKEENGYLPDIDELKALVTPDTKVITLNNPNNPTGALMTKEQLEAIVEVAREADAYLFCDETYRHLNQEDEWAESVVDLYEKGISTGSMSKVFSLVGVRSGWIVSRDKDFIKSCWEHRDYNLISGGIIDESVGALALANKEPILARNLAIVRDNLKVLDDFVNSQPRLHYVKPKAGTTALVYYEADIDSYDFCIDMYKKTGAFVTPGDCFEQPKSMRIGYAYGRQVLVDGLKALGDYLAMLD